MTGRDPATAFQTDLALRVRMGIALLLNGVLLMALLALAGFLLTVERGWAFILLFVGFAIGGAAHRRSRDWGPTQEREQIERVVSRLCLAGDLREPSVELVVDGAPLSWTTALPRGRTRIHVTTGMTTLLGDAELEAVIAHELSHIGNRDAMLMTVLAAPGVRVLRGLRAAWHQPNTGLRAKAGLIMFGCMFAPPAIASAGLCRMVSRHRELAADRGAALLTGSPAALASALRRLSDGLHAIPDRDLRVVAAADVLHVVPAKPARGIARLWATHPPLEDRIERLERLEARLQAG